MQLTAIALVLASLVAAAPSARHGGHKEGGNATFTSVKPIKLISAGPRPYYLIHDMDDGPLKEKLLSCSEKPLKATPFSFAHRGGGTLQFPEHSLESNLAGARMGAGVLECDVAFTKDRQLVCRHSQCDLHTTTNIVNIPELNAKCTTPFKPASNGTAATAKCCTSDITLAEFKSLCAKMDSSNATATTPADYLGGIQPWRTSLYNQCGTLMSHSDYLDLTLALKLDFTPELKTPEVPMPFQGDYTQEMYAQQLIDDYKKAGIKPSRVWPQSFLYADILYWIKHEPEFGKQALYLDENAERPEDFDGAVANLTKYKEAGVRYVSPPFNYLLTAKDGKVVPSAYGIKAKELGLGVVTWSLERSGPLSKVKANKDYYYSTYADAIKKDGDMYTVIDVLVKEVGVKAIFSDWSATVTYYANCMGLFKIK